jgi:hypothetical protein
MLATAFLATQLRIFVATRALQCSLLPEIFSAATRQPDHDPVVAH